MYKLALESFRTLNICVCVCQKTKITKGILAGQYNHNGLLEINIDPRTQC